MSISERTVYEGMMDETDVSVELVKTSESRLVDPVTGEPAPEGVDTHTFRSFDKTELVGKIKVGTATLEVKEDFDEYSSEDLSTVRARLAKALAEKYGLALKVVERVKLTPVKMELV